MLLWLGGITFISILMTVTMFVISLVLFSIEWFVNKITNKGGR